ncbi:hypothetical protein BDZ89DRAFT_1054874 [Hymenopellis radicata]|nr:hypothetical protein BDZ89DRAFT_1054874 [Hymenopellis radicata]
MPHEVVRRGPGGIYSQWVMERTIGNLEEEIKQHADAFSNLVYPSNVVDLKDGYALLPACDTAARKLPDNEMAVLREYFGRHGGTVTELTKVSRWARLHLPNGQTARCAWKESTKPLDEIRAARHVKVNCTILFYMAVINGNKIVRTVGQQKEAKIAEVLYYLHLDIAGARRPVAMVYEFGPSDSALLSLSYKTYWTAERLGERGLAVIDVKDIQAVVMMAPDKRYTHSSNYWFLMEKPGLKLISMVFGAADSLIVFTPSVKCGVSMMRDVRGIESAGRRRMKRPQHPKSKMMMPSRVAVMLAWRHPKERDSRLVTRVLRLKEVQFRLASDSTRDDSRVIASPLASTHHESESSRILESGEDGRGVREVVMGNGGGGGGGCGVDTSSHIIRPLTSSSSSCCILLLLLLIAVHLGRRVIAIIVEYCPLAGAYVSRPRFHEDDVKSVSIYMDADLESSAGVVVADLKSSDGSRPQDLLLAQSQQQQARHRARAKSTPHRLPDNRQSSGSDNRHSLGSCGGRGGGSEERNNTRSDADASLRDSARIAGSGRIIAHVSFSRRCGPFALQKIYLNICESSCDDSWSENQYSDSCSDSRITGEDSIQGENSVPALKSSVSDRKKTLHWSKKRVKAHLKWLHSCRYNPRAKVGSSGSSVSAPRKKWALRTLRAGRAGAPRMARLTPIETRTKVEKATYITKFHECLTAEGGSLNKKDSGGIEPRFMEAHWACKY